jgi:hypothetical protein
MLLPDEDTVRGVSSRSEDIAKEATVQAYEPICRRSSPVGNAEILGKQQI